jgi:predicted nuclease of predicted toxin-antitoxin system
MDEHVARAITLALRQRGVDVVTAQEDGRAGASDVALLDRATELRRVLFTQDDDLLAEAHRRQSAGVPFGGVMYAHQLRVTIGELVADLSLVAETLDDDELRNTVLFLPL